eukprot:TRINITY_DN48059_c0_g1_i1.p1 TRINITY_DN48059_c0_g1~~TRINITY_DN48059_c0_g1_i1.p1  ORF type:complete len:229 (-),score=58.68 TRINITY_DN48059_c0_g1_i1:95-781(-)
MAFCGAAPCCDMVEEIENENLAKLELTAVLDSIADDSKGKPGIHSSEYDADLVIEEKGMHGLAFDTLDEETCIVRKVLPEGAAKAWNQDCGTAQMIRGYDRVIKVNGNDFSHEGNSGKALKDALKECVDESKITFKRFRDFDCVIMCNGESLGMDLKSAANSSGIVIKKIDSEGLAATHNSLYPEQEIRPGDRIMEVNGCGGVDDMKVGLREAKTSKKVTLTIRSWRY